MAGETRRTDFFIQKKGIHIEIDKELHAELRIKLWKYKLSLGEVFEEFTRLVVNDVKPMNKILQSLVDEKLKKELKQLETQQARKLTKDQKTNGEIGKLDKETLYNLISAGVEKNKNKE